MPKNLMSNDNTVFQYHLATLNIQQILSTLSCFDASSSRFRSLRDARKISAVTTPAWIIYLAAFPLPYIATTIHGLLLVTALMAADRLRVVRYVAFGFICEVSKVFHTRLGLGKTSAHGHLPTYSESINVHRVHSALAIGSSCCYQVPPLSLFQ